MRCYARLLAVLFCIGLSANAAWAQDAHGYRITVDIEGLDQPYVILAYHYGDKPYIQDTAYAQPTGEYVFEGKEALPGGMYLVVMPPQNRTVDFFLDAREQHFTLSASMDDLVGTMSFDASPTNTLFYTYLKFLNVQREQSNALQAAQQQAKEKGDAAAEKKANEALLALNEEVQAYQRQLIAEHPQSFTTKFIQTSLDVTIPPSVDTAQQYWYYRNHYFDHADLSDGRLLRTPLLPGKIDRYVDKVVPQHPDSIIVAVDEILARATDPDIFKYLAIKLINKYASSKIVCMDAIYVHIADKYYLSGRADWIDDAQLAKIKEDADRLRPLLCDRIAPDIKLQTIPVAADEQPRAVSLHGVDAKYTVLVFWAPDCGHCKKSMPKVAEFYDTYREKGVEVFSVCTKTYKDYDSCVSFVTEKGLTRMMNLADPYLRSNFHKIYDVRSTPVIFLLDADKRIIGKRLDAEQLGEIIDNWEKAKAR